MISQLKCIFFDFWFADTIASSNDDWTVAMLPSSGTHVAMYTRCLRSMTMIEDHEHTRLWGTRKYICIDCQKIFTLKTSLVRHKTYECNNKEQRDHQSSSSSGNQRHNNAFQGSSNDHSTNTIVTNTDTTTTMTTTMTTSSSSSSSMNKIISTNIVERRRSTSRHACPKCNKSYAFFTSLWRHQHYECGIEPQFMCPICRAKFAQKSNLDRHVRTKH